ncbi:hypothetical protein [Streptomyces sp. N1]|uniref:hypothetical protein n=1 Tax=Streptomyces sp. N1 TaxID=576456 RepID=UPI001F50E366|nr:hypothetical protein [Streptomyces sp. N1]
MTTSTAEYDAFGRQTKATDAGGATTTVAHTPATGQEPTKTVTTNDLGHVTTDISDPLRSVTTATVDPNGKRTDMEYDALGRLIKAWEPAWSKADHPKTPSAEFAYSVTRTKPTVTTSKTINRNGEYESSYTFYDGLLREREAQSTALGTGGKGRVVSETFYDTRGQAWKAYSPYYAEGHRPPPWSPVTTPRCRRQPRSASTAPAARPPRSRCATATRRAVPPASTAATAPRSSRPRATPRPPR